MVLRTQKLRPSDSMTNPTEQPSSVMDVIIGKRIRLCRQAHRMALSQLATQIGIAWQQVQKYEMGKNRVSASMLWKIADVLDVPVDYFFEAIADDFDDAEALDVIEDRIAERKAERRAEKVLEMYTNLAEPQKKAVYSFLRSFSKTDQRREAVEAEDLPRIVSHS